MGHSTTVITKEQAVKETAISKTTEATSLSFFNGFSINDVDYVEKSDHEKPRYRFVFKNGIDWVLLETFNNHYLCKMN